MLYRVVVLGLFGVVCIGCYLGVDSVGMWCLVILWWYWEIELVVLFSFLGLGEWCVVWLVVGIFCILIVGILVMGSCCCCWVGMIFLWCVL